MLHVFSSVGCIFGLIRRMSSVHFWTYLGLACSISSVRLQHISCSVRAYFQPCVQHIFCSVHNISSARHTAYLGPFRPSIYHPAPHRLCWEARLKRPATTLQSKSSMLLCQCEESRSNFFRIFLSKNLEVHFFLLPLHSQFRTSNTDELPT